VITAVETADPADLDDALAVFGALRPRLFGIAYRMLGSVSEAEDLVQDVWLRWQTTDRSVVVNPGAFLSTAITRLAINASQSARARRETYVGPWLPEPVDTSADPYLGAEREEALGFAMLLLLERLSPHERAAYVLREAFDYPYQQIAVILESTEPAVRQLVSRARKHLSDGKRRPTEGAEQRHLLEAFVAAARTGDLAALERLLAQDVTSVSDGGGVVRASRVPVVGRTRVAKYHRAFAGRFWTGVEVEWGTANGQSVALLRGQDGIFAVLALLVAEGRVSRVLWMMNPSKIAALVAAPARGQ